MNNAQKKQLRAEIAQAAMQGINNYLSSTRGAQFFRKGRVSMIPLTETVQVSFHEEGSTRLIFVELTPKIAL